MPSPVALLSTKDLAKILATKITPSGEVQVAFDAYRRTNPAYTVRGRFFRRLDKAPPVVIGEVVYTVAFLTQAHEYVRTAYLGADAEKLLYRLAQGGADR